MTDVRGAIAVSQQIIDICRSVGVRVYQRCSRCCCVPRYPMFVASNLGGNNPPSLGQDKNIKSSFSKTVAKDAFR